MGASPTTISLCQGHDRDTDYSNGGDILALDFERLWDPEDDYPHINSFSVHWEFGEGPSHIFMPGDEARNLKTPCTV